MDRFLMTGAVASPTVRFLFATLLLLPAPTRAIEVAISQRDLVTDSDVIVVATLQDIQGRMQNGYVVEEGGLHVERVLCGDVHVGDVLFLRWQNHVNVACPRVEHGRNANESRIWFLERDDKGVLRANTNQRSWPVEYVETFLDTMEAYPYHVVTPSYDIGQPVIVTVEFRNANAFPISVPTVRVESGRVTHSGGFDIISNEMHLQPGSLERDASLARTALDQGETARVQLSLSDLLGEMPVGLHRFDVRVDGHRSTHGVHVRTEWQTGLERVRDTPREIPYHIQTIRIGGPGTGGSIMSLEMCASELSGHADELMALSDSLPTQTRLEVMRLISRLGASPETAMDFNLERIDCSVPEIRAAAGGGAGRLLQDARFDYRRDEATALLMSLLDDENPIVRRSAASAIGSARAAVALPFLKAIARYDGDAEVRRAARQAIDSLEGRNPCSGRSLKN